MQEPDDMELLRRYAAHDSQDAFALLVKRRVNLVYSTALRHVGSTHHAEEITQAVFVILAKKAPSLRPGTIISGWLYHATRLTAANFLRSEIQRTRREQEAHMQSALNEPETEVWTQIRPLLDSAMADLNERDRNAIVLRFFEGRNLREVGSALGASEDAAKKRVERAVEKLRRVFTKRGVRLSGAAIGAAVTAHSIQAAPVTLATTATAAALAQGATTSASTLTLIKATLKLMAWTKTKTTIAVGTATLLLTLGVGYVGFFHKTHPPQPGNLKLPLGEVTPAIGFGRSHGIVLASDGSLWAWGENGLGWPALGLGGVQNTACLRRIGAENDWINIAVGESHNLALKKDGSIWGWGGDLYDELGNHPEALRGKTRADLVSSTPVKSALGGDWKQIAAASEASFAIKNDGTLWAWGLNDFGQLGAGDFKDIPTPVQIGAATWTRICAGFINTAGLQSDGSLWAWGGGSSVGNTAPESAENHSAPKRLSPDTDWTDLAVGFNVVFAIKSDGTLWAWGYEAGTYTGSPNSKDTLTRIGIDNHWKTCSCCGSHYVVLKKKDGSLWCLSSPKFGQPAQLKSLKLPKDIIAFAGGSGLGAALTRTGELWTWGKVIGTHETGKKGSKLNLDPAFIVLNTPWQLSNVQEVR